MDDLAFVHDSWARSYMRGSLAYKALSPEEFHSFHRPIRERFLSRPTAAVIVAAETADPWHILGWIAVERIPSGLILQYIYVKSSYKKDTGLAAQLIKRGLPTGPIFFTHLTDHAARIMSAKHEQFSGWKHIPHLV